MASTRANPRKAAVGTTAWIAEERSSALQWTDTEAEGFTFAAHNEVEWLNEHMAEIFSQNPSKFADIFKTPGKLRGKTPRTARKGNALEARAPLSDVFSATPRGAPSPFRQTQFERQISTFRVAEDDPVKPQPVPIAKDSSPQRLIRTLDSGYHGSQSDNATEVDEQEYHQPIPRLSPTRSPSRPIAPAADVNEGRESEERRTTEGSFKSAKEEQTKVLVVEAQAMTEPENANEEPAVVQYPVLESPLQSRIPRSPTSPKRSPQRPVNVSQSSPKSPPKPIEPVAQMASAEEEEDVPMDDVQSPSEGSSPIRPIVRKSSLNFASLPAREPITTKKSIGNRASRTSHLDQTRTSYYGRQTGGKSLGNAKPEGDNDDEMDIDSAEDQNKSDAESKVARIHSKTSTQRLQDQISMLGQSQTNTRPHSKSIASNTLAISQTSQSNQPNQSKQSASQEPQQQKSPLRKDRSFVAPGAFPEDDEDSWIGPPTATGAGPSIFSPRPQMPKSHSTDMMEDSHGKDSVGGAQFNIPKRGELNRQNSPTREPAILEKTTSTLGHIKSVSTSVLRSPKKSNESLALSMKKGISVSNPNPSLSTDNDSTTPPKSPSRNKGSPLKAAKDKFSSILKTSRGLFASSAAISAEAKNSALSPPSMRPAPQTATEDIPSGQNELTYPSLDTHMNDVPRPTPASPSRSVRKTRASIEKEEKRKEEAKAVDQLEKARLKVKEEARQHHLEQERVATMEKQILARKEQEKLAKASQVDAPRAIRTSPRKTKAQLEAEGIAAAAAAAAAAVASTEEVASKETEMADTSVAMPPPALPRPKTASQIGRPGVKRPLKPTKETLPKAKAPTVIRVDTGSQRGHQYHPSNSTLAASLQDSLPAPASSNQSTLKNKASTASLKSSTSSYKSAASKALEAAAKKKEQDELAAQRKREAKIEVERQRAAIKEEERRQQEQQRRQEVERQRELQREKEQAASLAEAKKTASRQAMEKRRLEMEKAKQTRAPPPAVRPQPSTDLSHAASQDKALPPLPPQRAELGQPKPPRMNSAIHRSQDDLGRSVNSALYNTNKAPPKRPLQQDTGDDHHSRPQLQRNGPSYQQNESNAKRRKTSEIFDDDDTIEPQPRMMAPPIRQSSVRQKELPTKSLFPSGYVNAPPPTSNLQRSTLISQHTMNQSKPAHPMDMAQVSKAPITFTSSSSQPANQLHKTPARPAGAVGGAKSTAKSAARSSPRYQNGETIELPEINTDSEDDDEDADNDFTALGWTNSPEIRKQLVKQETIDPRDVFGPPGQLNMEEVFSKSKDRFHKFRARTSSANWTGQDRLTEDEIKKDLEARDRVRRQGGWTYDSMV